MISIQRLQSLLRINKEDETVANITNFAANVARTTRKHLLNIPTDKDITECINVFADHIGLVPTPADMERFLWLHPELKSRVMEFGATDTEVRSELHAAVFYFTLRTTDFVEGDTAIESLVAQQWKRIWQNT